MAITYDDPRAGRLKLSELVDIFGFAELAGVKPLTVHAYRKNPDRYAVPLPIAYVGNTPVWTQKQVMNWMQHRPGQGARSDLAG